MAAAKQAEAAPVNEPKETKVNGNGVKDIEDTLTDLALQQINEEKTLDKLR